MENTIDEVIAYLMVNKLLIFLEGLISSGKSTLCKSIEYHLKRSGVNYKYYPEPINEKLLNLFYSDIKKHAFSFQSIIIRERVHVYEDAVKDLNNGCNYVKVDRSAVGDCAFALMHHKAGNIDDQQFEVYADLTKSTRKINCAGIKKVIIFLNCTPKKARERVIIRGNPKEIKSCTLEYLQDLNHSYNRVLRKDTKDLSDDERKVIKQVYESIGTTNIVNIDYNEDFEVTNGYLSKDATFKILKQIIDAIK